jgi:CHAT domain-containing protein/tetratricopeptide (TPR) repeat protein
LTKACVSLFLVLLWPLRADQAPDPDRLFQEGMGKLDAGDPSAALPALREALAAYRARNDRHGEGQTLKAIGNAYYVSSKYAECIDFQDQALAVAQATGDKDLESRALLNLGNAYRDQGDPARAVPFYERSLALAKSLPGREVEANCRNGLGVAALKLQRYSQAEAELRASAELARALGNHATESNSLAPLGEVYEAMKAPAKALKVYEQLLPLTRGGPNRGRELVALMAAAQTSYDSGLYPQAIQYAAEVLELSRALNENEGIFVSLSVCGMSRMALGDNLHALDTYQQLLKYAREWKDPRREADALNFIGQLNVAMGDYLRAIDAHRQALAIARREGDAELEADSLANLGKVYVSLNALTTARDFHRQQLAVANKAHDPLLVYHALQRLGDLAIQASEYQQAVKFYRESLDLAPSLTGGAWEARALNHLAGSYEYLLDVPRTLEFAERALAAARAYGDRWEVWRALRVAAWAYQQHKDPKCLEYLKQTEDLSAELNLRCESMVLCDRGRAHLVLNQPDEALAAFERSLEHARQEHDPAGEGLALDGIGAAYQAKGDLMRAESALQQAVTVWEGQRSRLADEDALKVSVFERQAGTYRNLEIVQVARNRIESALETAERARARAFVELLERRLRNRNDGSADATVQPVLVVDIRRIARQEQATLVEYSILPEISQMFIWVVSPDGKIGFDRVKLPGPVGPLVASARNSLGAPAAARGAVMHRPQEESAGTQLERLHQLLVKPIAARLPSDPGARVVFIPQRELFFVPFAALRDEAGKYLIEKHSVLVAPSIQVLDLARRQQEQLTAAGEAAPLVVGNPLMPSVGSPPQQLPSLPGTENEAREIGRLLNVAPVLGADATKTSIVRRMPNARLVHLATHGLLEDLGDAGVPGAVALAPSAGDNGLLTASEILDLKMRAGMVVLSACDTGRGQITGDGVIGLSRSFISAGVPSVVVSLWPVSDTSTSTLMQEFYRRLAAGDAGGRDAALRNAMLFTMRTYPNPADWAAFVLVGAP